MNRDLFKQLLVVLVLVLVLSSLDPGWASAQGPTNSGEPGPSAVGVRVNPRQLPTIPRDGGPQQVREIPRLYPVDAASFGLMKAQANAAAQGHLPRPGTANGTAPKPRFDTIGFTGWNPPDGALAAGPISVLVAVNEAFAVYDKSGNLLLAPKSFQDLFGMSGSIFDPRALYDAANGRFVLLAVTMSTTGRTAFYTLAASQSSDPTGSWCTYKLNAVTGSGGSLAWADFPGLGMDGDYLYITSNQFRFGSNRYQYARILAIPKTSVYPTTGCPTATSANFPNLKNPDGSTAFTVQPANQPDALPGQTGMYFVNAIWASGSKLAVRSMTTSVTSLTLNPPTWVNVSAYNLPADAPQPSGNAIDSGDTRLGAGAIHRFGNIYTANTTGKATGSTLNAYANAQWYVFAPGATTATSTTVTDSNVAFYYPGVVPGSTFVGIQVSGSSASQPASAYSLRDGGTPTIYATGVAGYKLNSRWGDYPGVSSDPSNADAVWVLGEYAKATNAWGTAVTAVGP